ncbi:MAG TPA: hypothetical protein PLI51_06190 [bacterium]|nr:hypothetical protein [bacterium]HPQ66298.1 hypothetical protein [bacterium]
MTSSTATTGRDDPRIRNLSREIREHPSRASAYKEMARLLREVERPRSAAAVLRRGLENIPGDLGLLQHLARAQQQAGFHQAAEKTLRNITRAFPDHYLAYEKLERYYVRRGQAHKALAMYRRVEETAAFKEQSLERIVFVCKETSDVPGTLRALKKLVRGYGVTQGRARDLGRFHFKAGNWRESVRWLKKAFALERPDQELRITLALACARLGKWAEAERQLRTVLEEKPGAFAGLINLCELKLAAGKTEEARTLIADLDATFPGNSRVNLARGELALAEADPEAARAALEAGIRGTPYFYRWELRRGYGLLARACDRLGQREEAAFARTLTGALDGALDAYQAFMPLAEALIAEHDLDKAGRVLDLLERMFPGNTRAAVARGEILLAKGYPLRAVEAISSGLEKTPEKYARDKIRGYAVLSRAYRALGDWEQARQARRQAEHLEAELGE